MPRPHRRLRLLAPLLLAALVLTGCGDAQPASSPPASASPTTASPTPSTSPTAQPSGSAGVTVELSNYAKYADQPVVLSWKQTIEAVQASGNVRQVLPRVSANLSVPLRQQIITSLQQAWSNKWTVKPTVSARIATISGTTKKKKLTACIWGASYGYYKADGSFVGDPENYWLRIAFDLTAKGRDWMIVSAKSTGKCPGGAPQ